jgi:hypothetical protein
MNADYEAVHVLAVDAAAWILGAVGLLALMLVVAAAHSVWRSWRP